MSGVYRQLHCHTESWYDPVEIREKILSAHIFLISFLGGAYLPIEMSYPKHLIQSVLDDCEPVVVCTKASYSNQLNTGITPLFIEGDWVERYGAEIKGTEILRENVSLDDMAYTVYSSGTTGLPVSNLNAFVTKCSNEETLQFQKGIQCPHRGAVYSYTWRHLAFPYDEDDREACNVFFVWEMLRPLLKGLMFDLWDKKGG